MTRTLPIYILKLQSEARLAQPTTCEIESSLVYLLHRWEEASLAFQTFRGISFSFSRSFSVEMEQVRLYDREY